MFFKTTLGIISITLIALAWYASPIMEPFPKLTGPYQVCLKTVELN